MQPNLKHFHPFGCLVYVLQAPLQTRSPFPKWGERSRIGIFLCHSPHHASSVPLVLSTQTGLISPQFHCVFDDDFDTVKKEQADTSIWKIKAHLQEAKEIVTEKTTRSSLISAPTHQPTSPLPPYGRDIPQALQDLSQLLPDVPATGHQPEEPSIPPAEEPTPTTPIATPEAQDPVHVPVEHHQGCPVWQSTCCHRTLRIHTDWSSGPVTSPVRLCRLSLQKSGPNWHSVRL